MHRLMPDRYGSTLRELYFNFATILGKRIMSERGRPIERKPEHISSYDFTHAPDQMTVKREEPAWEERAQTIRRFVELL